MEQVRSRTFRSGNSEAVRLPKEIAFGIGTEVIVTRNGDLVTIAPAKQSVAKMIENLRALPKPPGSWPREPIEFPERGWLK